MHAIKVINPLFSPERAKEILQTRDCKGCKIARKQQQKQKQKKIQFYGL
jgi:hypothetical protein